MAVWALELQSSRMDTVLPFRGSEAAAPVGVSPADVTRTDASGHAAYQVVASFRVMAYRVVSTVPSAL